MLAILVKVEAISEARAVRTVDDLIALANLDLTSETSALRAAYKNDKAYFELLGVWCEVLDRQSPGLKQQYDTLERAMAIRMAGEDSAPRACSAYTARSVEAICAIAIAAGFQNEAEGIAKETERRNVGETSPWRAASANVDGIMRLLLVMLKHRAGREALAEANQIESDADTKVISEDSALRAQSIYWSAATEVMYSLICNR